MDPLLTSSERLKTAIWRLNVTSTGTTAVDVGNAGFSDDDVIKLCKVLGRNPILRDLNLSNNSFSEEGSRALARALRVNETLTKLDVRGNLIDDDGAEAIVESLRLIRSLRTLDLPGNAIGDAGLRCFAMALGDGDRGCCGLWTLRVGENKFGAGAAAGLLRSLRSNFTLTHLDLSRSSLEASHGATVGELLTSNRSLTTLLLDGNKLGDFGARALADAISGRTAAAAARGRGGGGGGGTLAAAAAAERRREAREEALAAKSGLSARPKGPGLRRLGLSSNEIGNDGAAALVAACGTFKSLTSLLLPLNQVPWCWWEGGVRSWGEVLWQVSGSCLSSLTLNALSILPFVVFLTHVSRVPLARSPFFAPT